MRYLTPYLIYYSVVTIFFYLSPSTLYVCKMRKDQMRKALIIDRNGSCYALFLPAYSLETTSVDYKRKTNLFCLTLPEKGYRNLSDNFTAFEVTISSFFNTFNMIKYASCRIETKLNANI